MSPYERLAELVGTKLLQIVAIRRGTILLQVEREGLIMALKCHDRSGVVTGNLANEARITRQLGGLIGDLYIESGSHSRAGPWLLLRWVEGVSLIDEAERIRLLASSERAKHQLRLFTNVVRTYQAVHRLGILHGDVQPAHVLIEQSRLVLLDWGLARTQGSKAKYRGALVHYASPEVAGGMLAGNDQITYNTRCEIYSLGALMYICMSGHPAVDYGSSNLSEITFRSKLERIAEGRLKGFDSHGSRGEQALQDVVMRCLSFDPGARYQSVEQLMTDLYGINRQEEHPK